MKVDLNPFLPRTLAYLFFVMMLGSGMIIAKFYSIPKGLIDPTKGALIEHFGYNNSCFYIDNMPEKYVAMFFGVVGISCWVVFLVMSWIDCKEGALKGIVPSLFMTATTVCTIFDVLIALAFLLVFAVHPNDNFLLHLVPFSLFIVSISGVGLRTVVYEFQYKWHGVPCLLKVAAWIYIVILLVISVQKVCFQFMGVVLKKAPPTWIGKSNDLIWMFLALFVPWVKATYQWCLYRCQVIGGIEFTIAPDEHHVYTQMFGKPGDADEESTFGNESQEESEESSQ